MRTFIGYLGKALSSCLFMPFIAVFILLSFLFLILYKLCKLFNFVFVALGLFLLVKANADFEYWNSFIKRVRK